MSSSHFLSADGAFSSTVSGYQVRDSQLDLCDAIDSAINNKTVLVAEAGTGIGKTFAYLVPAIHSGKKVIVSTGTRHLQDQLFYTDIPRVTDALDMPVKTALLKGRSNYLCLHRLQLAPHLGFMNRESQHQLSQVTTWSKNTRSGDVSELAEIPEDSFVWPMVTSTADNCIGRECDCWNDCFIVNARKAAQDADVLVINHHLLLSDMTLKEEGFAELLPGADAFIIDEAHQLHDVASRFFGESVSSRQLFSLARDAVAEQINDAPDMSEIREYAEQIESAARDFRLTLGEAGLKQAWNSVSNKPAVVNGMQRLSSALIDLASRLELASERGRGLEQCYQRCELLKHRIGHFHQAAIQTATEQNESDEDDASSSVLWYETFSKGFILHSTPIEVAKLFRKFTNNFSASWIFTSATLQVNKNFNHFANSMGLEDYRSGVWMSPFDYLQQSILYLPKGLPQPSDSNYTKMLIDSALPVLTASKGRAFLLFTSYRAMHEADKLLQGQVDYPVLMQGELPKHLLLAKFRDTNNAILLGTSSFWEGVDVRGEALSCVVIDKLPFASPGDPVMQARIDAIRQLGGQPFMELQVPQAVIALKQGVGRLIRDVNDHGVVMIGDPRLNTKSYGRVFLNSLPEMPVTDNINDVETFFSAREFEAGDEIETAGH